MKLLAIEARQNATYYLGRYQQVVDFGGDLFVLNGLGDEDFWPSQRYRVAGSQKIDDIIAAARAWHDEESFEGIITFSESAVVTVAAVAEALGLPSVGVDAARMSRNKLLMRQSHERGGVPHPSFRFVLTVEDALAAAEDFDYPVVLKPTLGAASNFVFRIDSPEEMHERFPIAFEGIRSMSWFVMECEGIDLGPAGLLVESFLDGHEHLFEALAWDGEVYLGSVVDRATAEGKNFDDDVHIAPTRLPARDMAEIQRVVEAAVRAQGIRRSTLHAEIRYHQGRPHLVEMAIRPGGGALDMVARVTADYCPIRAVMDVARGVKPRVRHYTPTGVHMMGTCLICQAGEVEYVSIPEDIVESEWTLMAKATAAPGAIIKRPPDGNSILGFLVVLGRSYQEVEDRLEEYASRIEVKLVGHPPMRTDTPWSTQPLTTA